VPSMDWCCQQLVEASDASEGSSGSSGSRPKLLVQCGLLLLGVVQCPGYQGKTGSIQATEADKQRVRGLAGTGVCRACAWVLQLLSARGVCCQQAARSRLVLCCCRRQSRCCIKHPPVGSPCRQMHPRPAAETLLSPDWLSFVCCVVPLLLTHHWLVLVCRLRW
jgi:hypothetical protein